MPSLDNKSVTVTGTVLDWAIADLYNTTLTANKTFTFSNIQAGKFIIVRVSNTTAGQLNVIFPDDVNWAGGFPISLVSANRTNIYTFFMSDDTVKATAKIEMA